MATKKKMLQAAAGQAGGAGLDITEVFSTYLYEGNSSTQTITNDIDLAGEGGLTWIKSRTNAGFHFLFDTERGAEKALSSELTNGEISRTGSLTAFNSNGFSVGSFAASNGSGQDYASWTFRKAPKFFTCLTYTGDGANGREISHDLGGTVGSIFVKKTNADREWAVYHRGLGATHYGVLNNAEQFYDQVTLWNDTEPTSTHFTVGYNNSVNTDGDTYVAYLFAHNDGDGEFGPDGDQDIIKCGSYTGDGSSDGSKLVDLGFEPQWVMIKSSTFNGGDWVMFDNMRGLFADGSSDSPHFRANSSNAEQVGSYYDIGPTANGFNLRTADGGINASGQSYIYMAIRRGPLAPPESGTEVFAIDTKGSTSDGAKPAYRSPFPVDAWLLRRDLTTSGGETRFGNRLTGVNYLRTYSTDFESSDGGYVSDFMNGWNTDTNTDSSRISWMWKRAPGFCDVVAYSGNSTAGRTVSHNLGVAPEMMWVKSRTSGTASYQWWVYHKDLGNNKALNLNQNYASQTFASMWNSTTPTQNEFILGGDTGVNFPSNNYISYLFATVPGVSKVGSYTGNGTSQTIDCGFTTGARFVLIKCASSSSTFWFVYDTARGIVSGNDPFLLLNTTDAEDTTTDYVDPDSSGFIVNGSTIQINNSGDTYIFYAIA